MSPSERRAGKISRVTFNAALKPIFSAVEGSDSKTAFEVLSAYVQAWLSSLRDRSQEEKITNPTLFRAIMLLFPAVAEKVSDRYGDEFTADNFAEVLRPVVSRTKKSYVETPGGSPSELYDVFRKQLESGFSLSRKARRP